MPKHDLHHLVRKGRTWFVVQDVPRDLRKPMGKRRLSRSLHTHDIHVAMAERHAVLAEFAAEFKSAREPGEADATMREAMAWRDTAGKAGRGDGSAVWVDGGGTDLRHKQWLVQALIDERALEIAGLPDWEQTPDGRPVDPQRLATARQFAGIAYGTSTPLLLHAETWLAEGNRRAFRPSTVKGHRIAVGVLAGLLKQRGVTTIEGCTRAVVGLLVSELALTFDPATIHVRLAAMSSYWQWLLRKGVLDENVRNPWRGQDIAARPTKVERRSASDDELATLLAGDPGPEIHDLIRLLALSGLRVEEAYSLKVADCRDGWLHVREGKGGKPRAVPMHSALAEIVARRCAGKKPDAYLMHEGASGERRSMNVVIRFGRYRESVGVHERAKGAKQSLVTLHSLRKWFATQARRHADVHTVAILLGHAGAGITDKTYNAGPTGEMLQAAVESVALPAGGGVGCTAAGGS